MKHEKYEIKFTVSGVKKYPATSVIAEKMNINQKLKCQPRCGFSTTKPPTIGPITDLISYF